MWSQAGNHFSVLKTEFFKSLLLTCVTCVRSRAPWELVGSVSLRPPAAEESSGDPEGGACLKPETAQETTSSPTRKAP